MNPKETLQKHAKTCKNYIIVKYLVGVADVLQVILDDVWYPHKKCDEHGNIIDPRPGRFLTTNIIELNVFLAANHL
jgi:hypothetical protein